MKEHKKQVMITSVIILIPIIIGLLLWNKLPNEIATHFGANGEANGWSSKVFTVFAMPLIMLGLHLLCLFMMLNDPKKSNINRTMFRFTIWIIPLITIVVFFSIYGNALGISIDSGVIMNIVLGILFIVMGNYLPKLKRNYTVGIKISWTLNSDENWRRTHRLAGWLFFLCGIIFLINTFFLWPWIIVAVLIATFIPGVYSFTLYKKGI